MRPNIRLQAASRMSCCGLLGRGAAGARATAVRAVCGGVGAFCPAAAGLCFPAAMSRLPFSAARRLLSPLRVISSLCRARCPQAFAYEAAQRSIRRPSADAGGRCCTGVAGRAVRHRRLDARAHVHPAAAHTGPRRCRRAVHRPPRRRSLPGRTAPARRAGQRGAVRSPPAHVPTMVPPTIRSGLISSYRRWRSVECRAWQSAIARFAASRLRSPRKVEPRASPVCGHGSAQCRTGRAALPMIEAATPTREACKRLIRRR
jgi:hypothetical protein